MSSGSFSEKIDLTKLVIRPLDSTMDRAAFCCGKPELDNFFRNDAGDHHERYALTLEAINEQKAATYQRWGFTPFIDGELLMYIPVATIRAALAGAADASPADKV